MKLLFLTDSHVRGTNPRARTDDYTAALLRKLGEVKCLAEQHHCEAILHGGDLTDAPDPANSVIAAQIRAYREMPCPVYAVAGNHDLYGAALDSLGRTALDVIAASGAIRLIEPGHPVVIHGEYFTVQISGQPYHADMDRRDWRQDYCVYAEEGMGSVHVCPPEFYSIHIVHGMLRTSPLAPGVPTTLVQDVLRETTADVTLAGHDHIGFGIVRDGLSQPISFACNPGALMRTSAARAELARPVQVALITVTYDGLDVQLIPLTTAEPADQVLDRSHLDDAAERQAAMEGFLGDLSRGGEFKQIDVPAIVQEIADRDHVRPEVRQEALQRIAAAAEAAGEGEVEP